MPDAEITNRLSLDGISFIDSRTIAFDGPNGKTAVRPVAKVGQLTTRTDNNTGVLTMVAGHGIISTNRVDVYWVGGSRRGMTATVAVNAVTVDGGAGDNLPANLTAVTAQVPQEEELLATGDNIQALGAKASRRGIIVFTDDADVELLAIVDSFDDTTGGGYQWFTGNGLTNPLAGTDIAKVYFSNGDSAVANTLTAMLGLD